MWYLLGRSQLIFIDRVALAKQGDNALGSAPVSMCLACALTAEQQRSTTLITSLRYLAYSDNLADAVDRILISIADLGCAIFLELVGWEVTIM